MYRGNFGRRLERGKSYREETNCPYRGGAIHAHRERGLFRQFGEKAR
jgi:hypothetical protein